MKWCEGQCPIVKKCCFCVPIRKGVVIFGYVNLVLSLLAFPLLVFLLVEELTRRPDDSEVPIPHRFDPVFHLPVTIAFLMVDVIMSIVLLVGAHKRNQKILKGYFYFGVLFQALTLSVDLFYFDFHEYFENIFYLLLLSLNIYLLFLVYHTVRLIDESSVRYVAHQDQRHLII